MSEKAVLKVFISFCGVDRMFKNIIKNKLNSLNEYFNAKEIALEIVEMDTHCFGDWATWMINAVSSADCIIPIITDNVLHADVEKRVYEEIVEARNKGKIRIPFIISDDNELPANYRANLNGTSEIRVNSNLSDLDNKLDELVLKTKNSLDMVCKGFVNQEDIMPEYLELNDEDYFVGREKEMQEIRTMLENNNVVILYGEGGIGKTSLAKQFFLKNKDLYSKAYLLSSPNGIKDSIGNLHLNNVYSSSKDLDERYKDNLNHLRSLSEKTILIMDNCDCGVTKEEISNIRNLHCRFIITSRPSFESDYIIKRIGPMEDEDLIKMVYKKYPSIEKDNSKTTEEVKESLIKLFEYAGRHTLTIEMAAAIMNSGDLSIEEITDRLLEVTETCKTAHTDKKNTIYERLSTLYNLVDLSLEEKRIIHSLSLVSPINGIERKQLKRVLNLSDNNAINHLIENTFIKFDEEKKKVNLHPLFSDVVFKKENIENLFSENKDIIDWILSYEINEGDISTKKIKKEYCEYIHNKRETILKNEKKVLIKLLSSLSDLYKDLSDVVAAIEVCNQALNIIKEYSNSPNLVSETYTKLGWLYLNNSEYDNAYNSLMNALDIQKQLSNNNQSQLGLGDAYNNLGVLCKDIGDFEKSEIYYKEALAIKNNIFKDGLSQSVALTYNNLGYLYREMGKFNEAREFILKALEIQKNIFQNDINRPEIALTYNLLGLVSKDLKEFNEAEKYFKESLEIRLKIYKDDPNHFDLATTYNNLGSLYRDLKMYPLSITYLQKSLSIKKIIYRDNLYHPWIANTYHNLGLTYLEMNDFSNSEECFLEALKIRENVFKAHLNHPVFAPLYRDIGILYLKQNKYQEAIEMLNKAKEIFKYNGKTTNIQEIDELLNSRN